MRNFQSSFLTFFCLIPLSFSQTKSIEKGTYILQGQKIKLNLLEDNKYELFFYSGNYEIKGDLLLFSQTVKCEAAFDVSFKNDKNDKKIKIKFRDPFYYLFYIGTQNGTKAVEYQKLTGIRPAADPDGLKSDFEFEINRADYWYLVNENYQGKSNISKFVFRPYYSLS